MLDNLAVYQKNKYLLHAIIRVSGVLSTFLKHAHTKCFHILPCLLFVKLGMF